MNVPKEILLMIIQGGIESNKRKVKAYSYMLAANMKEEDEIFELLEIKKERIGINE